VLGVAEAPEIEFSEEDLEEIGEQDVVDADEKDGADLQADIEAEVAELLGETGPDSAQD
jgi:hypothetical protein